MNIAHITIAGHYLQGGHQKKKKKKQLPVRSVCHSSPGLIRLIRLTCVLWLSVNHRHSLCVILWFLCFLGFCFFFITDVTAVLPVSPCC